MLRKNTLQASRPVINALVRRGIGLESIDDTPIDDLVVASTPMVDPNLVQEISESETPVDVILEVVEDAGENSVTHSAMIDTLVDQGSAGVAKVIDKARNVVIPAIAKTVDAVVKKVDRKLYPQNDVAIFNIDALAGSTAINGLLQPFKGADIDLVTVSDLPAMDDDTLGALLETGSAEANEQILSFLADKPKSYLGDLVNDLLRGSLTYTPDVTKGEYNPFLVYGTNGAPYIRRSVAALPHLIIACVILRNLNDNPPEGTRVTISQWNEVVVSALSALASNYHVILGDVANHIASGQLYMPTTLRQGEYNLAVERGTAFPILDRVYDRFLEQEGYPELLFALTLPDVDMRQSQASVIEAADVLNAKWAGYVENFRNNALATLDSAARDVVLTEIGKVIGELDLSELAVTPDEIWEAVKNAMDDETITTENLYTVVRFLLAGVIYARYQTLVLITAMDDYMAGNPDADPRTAAYHGVKAYVCEWTASQLLKV